jgi:hypothetical protein
MKESKRRKKVRSAHPTTIRKFHILCTAAPILADAFLN